MLLMYLVSSLAVGERRNRGSVARAGRGEQDQARVGAPGRGPLGCERAEVLDVDRDHSTPSALATSRTAR